MSLSTRPSLAIQSVTLPSGVTLQYVEQGNPDGVPMVLLHGLSDSLHSYDLVLPYLPPSIRAFALSQRGHGDSSRPAGYLPSEFAADVAAFLNALGIVKAVIVGHSMGSSMARRFVLDYPERTLGLVLLGSFAGFSDNPVIDEFAPVIEALEDPIDPQFALEFQSSTVTRPLPPGYLDLVVQESLKVPARVWQGAVAGLMSPEHPTTVQLGRVHAPTLIVWGDQDAYCTRSDQDALLASIGGSELKVYEGTGHALHWEEPERTAADLVAFAQQLGAV